MDSAERLSAASSGGQVESSEVLGSGVPGRDPDHRAGLSTSGALAPLAEQISRLREQLVAAETQWATQIARVDESNLASAVNLAHYWAIRQSDLRGCSSSSPPSDCPRWAVRAARAGHPRGDRGHGWRFGGAIR